MAKTAQDIMNLIQKQNIQMVDFKIVDINGQYRHVTIPAKKLTTINNISKIQKIVPTAILKPVFFFVKRDLIITL